jgi:hypothetical protein
MNSNVLLGSRLFNPGELSVNPVVNPHLSSLGSDSSPFIDEPTLGLDCPVCLKRFRFTDYVYRLERDHIFHVHCLIEWTQRKQSCPTCREEIAIEMIEAVAFETLGIPEGSSSSSPSDVIRFTGTESQRGLIEADQRAPRCKTSSLAIMMLAMPLFVVGGGLALAGNAVTSGCPEVDHWEGEYEYCSGWTRLKIAGSVLGAYGACLTAVLGSIVCKKS